MRFLEQYTYLYQTLLDRTPEAQEIEDIKRNLGAVPALNVAQAILSSAEYISRGLDHSLEIHLSLIHQARVKLVSSLLPKADLIVDIGGANGNLYDMGYPHFFRELTIIDLPDQARCDLYKGLKLEARVLPFGRITVLYTNATDLSSIPGASVDMVWMGQVIEHVTEEESFQVYSEVKRILRHGGHFCLDTPNRNLTEIHTKGWIHPEHKIEYYPAHLRKNLSRAGFRIERELGVCEMLESWRTKTFAYSDFFLGGGISPHVDGCYIQYYDCTVER